MTILTTVGSLHFIGPSSSLITVVPLYKEARQCQVSIVIFIIQMSVGHSHLKRCKCSVREFMFFSLFGKSQLAAGGKMFSGLYFCFRLQLHRQWDLQGWGTSGKAGILVKNFEWFSILSVDSNVSCIICTVIITSLNAGSFLNTTQLFRTA